MRSAIRRHVLLVSCAVLLTGPIASADKPSEKPTEKSDYFPRWSLVGEWHVNHPEWTEDLIFKADGTFAVKDKTEKSGTWVLTAEAGTPLLVLRWHRYATESLLMVNTEQFRGTSKPDRWIDMRRVNVKKVKGGELKEVVKKLKGEDVNHSKDDEAKK